MDISNLTREQKEQLFAELKADRQADDSRRRHAYETLRHQFASDVEYKLIPIVNDVKRFHGWLIGECEMFRNAMRSYGRLRRGEEQSSYSIIDNDFKIEVKSSRVKSFDERADLAAERLINYLRQYVGRTDKGTEDPMYQLAMTLLERNKQGDLDYRSISKLYGLESRFDEEYSEIMQLFKESNVMYKTAVNYYFYKRDSEDVWRKVELSFCRL